MLQTAPLADTNHSHCRIYNVDIERHNIKIELLQLSPFFTDMLHEAE